jgi:predicted hotdog family 3-hydroxylacyl-ACP dehydratase
MSIAFATHDPRPFLPHEGDTVLLDAVWAESATRTRATATVRAGTPFFDDAGSGLPGWPAWLAIELLAQVVAASAGLREYRPGVRPRLGLLLGARQFSPRVEWLPEGARLALTVDESSRDEDGMGVYDGQVAVAGEVVASATLSVYLPADVDAYLQGLEP